MKIPSQQVGLSILAAILTLTLDGCALPLQDQAAVVVDSVTPPHTATTPPPASEPAVLKPGQFTWHPERAPQGSVMVVVSLSDPGNFGGLGLQPFAATRPTNIPLVNASANRQ